MPLNEVRQYLLAKYEARFNMHPQLFEETVASVFRDHGYTAEVTAYHCDGGIDVVLRNANGEEIGVQVKRYRKSIDVSQIREFTGALFLGEFTKGCFVTTSRYQKGVKKVTKRSKSRGIAIELLDAKRFFEMLQIRRIDHKRTKEEWLEIARESPYLILGETFRVK